MVKSLVKVHGKLQFPFTEGPEPGGREIGGEARRRALTQRWGRGWRMGTEMLPQRHVKEGA